MNANINNLFAGSLWDESCLVGIDILDQQHKNFFSMLDELAYLNRLDNKREEVLQLLNKFEEYTIYHFNTEEKYMDKTDYPDIEKHKNLHKLFTKRIEDFKIAYGYDNKVILEEMISYTRKWMLVHIRVVDIHTTFDKGLITE
ncbi:MAG: hemerythrin-like metal-binding protein [Bacteroidetes bacterium]|nr:hemerythrin-like metal-binding protein [Bacteroidota bacterium]